jgi:hypothetical protein
VLLFASAVLLPVMLLPVLRCIAALATASSALLSSGTYAGAISERSV